jgi:tetratricopeptide (TPR) repeat protein
VASLGNLASILKYRVAVALARQSGDPLRIAHRVRHLGDAYHYAGRAALAEPCYVEALGIYRREPHTGRLDLANAIRSFAVLKHEADATDEAQRLWQEAHDLYAGLNISPGVAESAARLALLARARGELPRSRNCLTEARAAANSSGDPDTLQYVREVTAQIEAL